jgi:hypothetical protein
MFRTVVVLCDFPCITLSDRPIQLTSIPATIVQSCPQSGFTYMQTGFGLLEG